MCGRVWQGFDKNQQRPSLLQEKAFVAVVPGGFEPPQTEPKTVVLPLHHRTIVGAKVVIFYSTAKFLARFFVLYVISICKRTASQELSQERCWRQNRMVDGREVA